MPPRPNQLLLVLTAYILTLFTFLHVFRLALDLSPGTGPQTSNVNASFSPPTTSAWYNPEAFLINILQPKLENGQGGSWLARLGWGLGEATVEILESSPPRIFEARMAFFGRSIPAEGLVGWLVPLDSLFRPCDYRDSESRIEEPFSISPPPRTQLPPPFLPLDGGYVPLPDIHDDDIPPSSPSESSTGLTPNHPENTGCQPLCPISQINPSSLSSHIAEPSPPFPNITWLALVRRGTCSFAAKAQFAELLGASGLIVGGLDESLISMSAGSGDGEIGIQSVFVGNKTYTTLVGSVQESGVRLGVNASVATGQYLEESVSRSVKTILVRLEGEPPWEWYMPILSVLLVLSLPSLLTLCTLFVHRMRAERREREMRAPEDVVAGLPIRVWSGVRWEKDLERGHPNVAPTERSPILPVRSVSKEDDRGLGLGYGAISSPEPSTSAPRADPAMSPLLRRSSVDATAVDATDTKRLAQVELPAPQSPTRIQRGNHRHEDSDETIPRPPWFTSQTECAICLCNFEVGDRVRVLPCGHVFHLDEVDPWLIKQRKVCPVCKYDVTNPPTALVPPSASPLASAAVLPADVPPRPSLDSLTDLPLGNIDSSSSSDSAGPSSPPLTAAQLLASVDGRQRGWRRWLGRRFTPGSASGSDENVDRRGEQPNGE